MIVLGTVLLNATTARMVAKLLEVTLDASEGILIIGANGAARIIGEYLQDNNRHVVLIDNNETNIKKAKEAGLEAFFANIYTDDLGEHFELLDMGYMVAMTSSADVNQYAVRKYQKVFGENGAFRLITPEELKKGRQEIPQQGIFSYTDDFLNLNEVARDYPFIHEADVSDLEGLKRLINRAAANSDTVPLFFKTDTGSLEVIPPKLDDIAITDRCQLVYLGKKLEEAPAD